MTNTSLDTDLLDAQTLANLLSVSRRAVYRLAHSGMPSIRLKHRIMFNRFVVAAWIGKLASEQKQSAA